MRALAMALALLTACSRPLAFQEYREPDGEFSVSVPVGWQANERGPFSRKPIGEVWWLGEQVAHHEGWPVGVLLFVRKLDRDPDKRNKVYRDDYLAPTDALFSGTHPKDVLIEATEFAGYPARKIGRDFDDHVGGGWHGRLKTFPSRMVGVVIQTPNAYYVLEYRAVHDRFDKYKPAFDTLVASFKLTKSPPPTAPR